MWARLLRPASEARGAELALRLTCVGLLLRPMGPWGVRPLLLALAALALVSAAILRAPLAWLAIAVLVAARVVVDWPLPDNHVYLLGYWALAAGLALGARDCDRTLAQASRLLVGLAFALSVLWKAGLSPDYLDGRFFRVTLVRDARFEHATLLLGGLDAAELEANRRYLEPLPEGAELLDPGRLHEPARFRVLVMLATWGMLGLEAAVATLFLLPPGGRRRDALRHAALLGFCVITYALAPVAGFGWLLLALGLTQCAPEARRLRTAYLATWILVLLYTEVPWAEVALHLVGG